MIRWSSAPRRLAVLLTSGIAAALLLSNGSADAEPILVSGHVLIDSAGGDFPDFTGPVNELIYSLAGAGLPSARGESLETIPELGNRGGLHVSRSPSRAFDIDTRALLFSRTLRGSGIGEVTFAPANPAFFQSRYSLNPVPEPGTLLLFASGLGWMVVRRRGRPGSDA